MKPFRLATFAVFVAATVPRLAHRGMFVDGVTYASIARNLAEGRGSFWSPSYTATLYPQFHEHPPLGFWLQSLWFRLFGDHLFVERLYTLIVALGTAGLISLIWRQLDAEDDPAKKPVKTLSATSSGLQAPGKSLEKALPEARSPKPEAYFFTGDLDWLPVLLWISVPVVSWAIVGNLLETTVAFFTTGALLAALTATQGLTQKPGKPRSETTAVQRGLSVKSWFLVRDSGAGVTTGWSVLSGLCIVAACLAKGPVGLFPLVAPIAFLLLPGKRHVWRALAMQWTTVAVCTLLLWTSGSARASLTEYVNQQVIAALAGEREVSSSLTVVKTLLQGVLLPMLGAGALAAAAARRFVGPSPAARGRALPFLLVGLSGTLPILASAKQAGHYLVPAVPLFALAVALVIAPTVEAAVDRFGAQRQRTVINIVTALVTLGAVGASLSPAVGRDRERLADLDAMASTVPWDGTVGLCAESNADWGLHAWFQRRFHASLDAAGGQQREWFLQTARAGGGCVPSKCAAVTDPRRQLVLMKCRRSD